MGAKNQTDRQKEYQYEEGKKTALCRRYRRGIDGD